MTAAEPIPSAATVAFLLLVHTDPESVGELAGQLLEAPGTEVFIHLDQKSYRLRDQLPEHPRVHTIETTLDIRWGDYAIVEAVAALLHAAENASSFDYYSLHSGQDLAIRPVREFLEFLGTDKGFAYLDANPLPAAGWGAAGGLERVALHWPKLFRKRLSPRSPLRQARAIYGRLYKWGIIRGKRLPDGLQLYGGSQWFTVSRECIHGMAAYLREHPRFNDLFRDALIPDEIYFNTLAYLAAQELGQPTTLQDNLRYIDWSAPKSQMPGSPKTLTLSDFEAMANSRKFFARKFSREVDAGVRKLVLDASAEKPN